MGNQGVTKSVGNQGVTKSINMYINMYKLRQRNVIPVGTPRLPNVNCGQISLIFFQHGFENKISFLSKSDCYVNYAAACNFLNK